MFQYCIVQYNIAPQVFTQSYVQAVVWSDEDEAKQLLTSLQSISLIEDSLEVCSILRI